MDDKLESNPMAKSLWDAMLSLHTTDVVNWQLYVTSQLNESGSYLQLAT